MNILARSVAVLFTMAIVFAAGCGGGGGGGGANPPPGNPPPTGGITRTGVAVAVGPITGFGSVIVNGVTYATDGSTEYFKDGLPAVESDFSVGEMVVVKGGIDDNNTNATADTVESNDIVEGPVSSHDPAMNQIVVLGQTVRIVATTSIDNSCPADLTTVPAVEVYGTADSTGLIEATRIECRDATWDGVMEINGIATNVQATTFEINGFTIDYSIASVDNFPTPGVISENDPVEAKGDSFNGNALEADRVEYQGNRFEDNEGDHIEIEGFITRFVSAADFDVSGIPVTTNGSSTTFQGGAAGDLGLNLKVEVEGEFDGSGVLNATKVEIKTATAIRVTGRLDSVTGDTLVILGITVNTSPTRTRFEDKSSAREDPMNVGLLNPDDYVDVRGQEQPPGQITAMIVERDDPDTRTELRGFVEVGGKNEPNLTVLGVTIATNSETTYRDSRGSTEVGMTAGEFWLAVQEGSLVDARGTETDTMTLTASEVALEME